MANTFDVGNIPNIGAFPGIGRAVAAAPGMLGRRQLRLTEEANAARQGAYSMPAPQQRAGITGAEALVGVLAQLLGGGGVDQYLGALDQRNQAENQRAAMDFENRQRLGLAQAQGLQDLAGLAGQERERFDQEARYGQQRADRNRAAMMDQRNADRRFSLAEQERLDRQAATAAERDAAREKLNLDRSQFDVIQRTREEELAIKKREAERQAKADVAAAKREALKAQRDAYDQAMKQPYGNARRLALKRLGVMDTKLLDSLTKPTAEERKAELEARYYGENMRSQIDARSRAAAVAEGNLGLRGKEFEAKQSSAKIPKPRARETVMSELKSARNEMANREKLGKLPDFTGTSQPPARMEALERKIAMLEQEIEKIDNPGGSDVPLAPVYGDIRATGTTLRQPPLTKPKGTQTKGQNETPALARAETLRRQAKEAIDAGVDPDAVNAKLKAELAKLKVK